MGVGAGVAGAVGDPAPPAQLDSCTDRSAHRAFLEGTAAPPDEAAHPTLRPELEDHDRVESVERRGFEPQEEGVFLQRELHGLPCPEQGGGLHRLRRPGQREHRVFQSRTWTYTRSPFCVVTPQGRGVTGPPRVP